MLCHFSIPVSTVSIFPYCFSLIPFYFFSFTFAFFSFSVYFSSKICCNVKKVYRTVVLFQMQSLYYGIAEVCIVLIGFSASVAALLIVFDGIVVVEFSVDGQAGWGVYSVGCFLLLVVVVMF